MTIAILWALAVVAGVVIGASKNRLGLALTLTFLLAWVGVIIIALVPSAPPGPRPPRAPRPYDVLGPGERE